VSRSLEIVGGGVAGLSLGIALRGASIPVTVREAGSYPRHRLCGEFLNGVSEETLTGLGLSGIFAGAKTHRSMRWWLRNELIAESLLEHPVRALSRWELDERMRVRFEEMGGVLQSRDRVSPEPREGQVWAAGRRPVSQSKWFGLKAHYTGLTLDSGLEMHLGDGGYVGLTSVEEGRVNVCGLFEKRLGVKGKGEEILLTYLEECGLDSLVSRLRAGQVDERSITGVAGVSFGEQGYEQSILALGDAERMIPPFTGNGMSMAFESAECAFDPLRDYSRGKHDWEASLLEVSARLKNRFHRRLTLAKGMHPFVLNSPGRDLLVAAAKSGLLPFSLLNRLFT